MSTRAPFWLGASLALAGCVAGPPPKIATPTPELPSEFLYQPDANEQIGLNDLLPSYDPAFMPLTTKALESSPNLAGSIARIERARAQARGAGAARLPSVGVESTINGTRLNPNQFSESAASFIDTEQVSYGANLTANWEVDLFGRLKAREQAALAQLNGASATSEAVRIALVAEIAATLIDWRTLEARRNALKQDLAAAERISELADELAKAGLRPGFEQLRQEANASQSRTRLAALESEEARLIGRLVITTGLPTPEVMATLGTQSGEIKLPAPPSVLPSTLLRNRPDIRAAEAELMAADASLASAARQRFPRLTLSAALGLLAFDLSNLFDSQSEVYTLTGGIAAPLLDFGRIQSEIDGAAADKQAAFAAYRGSVFTALGEAETAYGLVAAADREAQAAIEENKKLERVAQLAETRFRAGLEDSLSLFEARRVADTSGERAAAAIGRAQRARAILWQALGGGELIAEQP